MIEESNLSLTQKINEENKENIPFLKMKHSLSLSTNADQFSSENITASQQLSQYFLSSANISQLTIGGTKSELKIGSTKTNFDPDYNKLNNYKIIQIIGKGTFGKVYRAIFLPLHKQVALKVVNFNEFEEQLRNQIVTSFQQQIELLKDLQSKSSFKFTYQFYGGFKHEDAGYLVMQLLYGFTLEDLIQSNLQLSDAQSQFYLASIVLAIEQMHEYSQCIHRDLKPQNLMILHDGSLLLLDFGCAKKLKKWQRTTTILGTCEYFSPSRFKCDYGHEADYWSFAVIAYQMITKRLPFTYKGIQQSQQQQKFRRLSSIVRKKKQIHFSELEKHNENLHLMVKNLLTSILANEKDKQYFTSIKQSEYFTNFDWDLLMKNKFKPPKTYTIKEIEKIKQNNSNLFEDF